MKNAIVTGACCGVGKNVCKEIRAAGFSVTEWCRHSGVDLTNSMPDFEGELNLFVHVAKLRPDVLVRILNKFGPKLQQTAGAFVSLSSVAVLDRVDGYATSKKEQEQIIGVRGWDFLPATINALRLGPIVADSLPGIPWTHPATGVDVGRAVLHLVSNPWITASIISVNRGI